MVAWDEEKRKRNLRDHAIDFADLESYFDGDLLTREDRRIDYGETRFQSVGYIQGIAVFVVWTPRGDDDEVAHLISARKAEKHEEKAWLARFGKHGAR